MQSFEPLTPPCSQLVELLSLAGSDSLAQFTQIGMCGPPGTFADRFDSISMLMLVLLEEFAFEFLTLEVLRARVECCPCVAGPVRTNPSTTCASAPRDRGAVDPHWYKSRVVLAESFRSSRTDRPSCHRRCGDSPTRPGTAHRMLRAPEEWLNVPYDYCSQLAKMRHRLRMRARKFDEYSYGVFDHSRLSPVQERLLSWPPGEGAVR